MEAVATKFADAVNALGLKYHVDFVPFSRSRHAKPKPTLSDLQLNWHVYLGQGPGMIVTDYSQGIAHIPGYKQSWGGGMTLDQRTLVGRACELGVVPKRPNSTMFEVKIAPPPLAEVMASLVLDASAIDHPVYESWACDFGYDVDSRKGEAIYRACLEIGLKLRALIGDRKLQELREAAQEL